MEKLKLNKEIGKPVTPQGYKLSETKKYVIDLGKELNEQTAILEAVRTMGLEAMNDWWDWLKVNNFSTDMPNPTNDFVEKFYGVKFLWKTDLSQGLVVKDEHDDDYYILMECSRENKGFKYTQIVLTLGGCM
ncbi:MAG: hypothetical protein KC455_10425 [Carnobacterium sp.]|nr:hypothetical protein [Carnobacterium sp.]